MERILAIVTAESRYAESLAAYLKSRPDFIFIPMAFSDYDSYCLYDSVNHVDMLLCDEAFVQDRAREVRAENICLLSEYDYRGEEGPYREIFKYQVSENIMREIVSIYGGRGKAGPEADQADEARAGGSRIYSVCSPAGDCYKSTFALALADFFSRGGRTLFLSFDPFFVFPSEDKHAANKNLTDILYYLEAYGQEPLGLLEKISHRVGNLDYIGGVSHWFDICSMKPDHMLKLLEAIEQSKHYETIIMDIGVTGRAGVELLNASDKIYMPVGRGYSHKKINEWKRQLGFAGYEDLAKRLEEVEIPYDELLAGDYSFDLLLKGRVGRYIEEREGCRNNR